jgi:hypothetical protein
LGPAGDPNRSPRATSLARHADRWQVEFDRIALNATNFEDARWGLVAVGRTEFTVSRRRQCEQPASHGTFLTYRPGDSRHATSGQAIETTPGSNSRGLEYEVCKYPVRVVTVAAWLRHLALGRFAVPELLVARGVGEQAKARAAAEHPSL